MNNGFFTGPFSNGNTNSSPYFGMDFSDPREAQLRELQSQNQRLRKEADTLRQQLRRQSQEFLVPTAGSNVFSLRTPAATGFSSSVGPGAFCSGALPVPASTRASSSTTFFPNNPPLRPSFGTQSGSQFNSAGFGPMSFGAKPLNSKLASARKAILDAETELATVKSEWDEEVRFIKECLEKAPKRPYNFKNYLHLPLLRAGLRDPNLPILTQVEREYEWVGLNPELDHLPACTIHALVLLQLAEERATLLDSVLRKFRVIVKYIDDHQHDSNLELQVDMAVLSEDRVLEENKLKMCCFYANDRREKLVDSLIKEAACYELSLEQLQLWKREMGDFCFNSTELHQAQISRIEAQLQQITTSMANVLVNTSW